MCLEACQAASGSITKIPLPSAVSCPVPCISSDLPEEDQGLQLKWPWALRATPGSGGHTWPGWEGQPRPQLLAGEGASICGSPTVSQGFCHTHHKFPSGSLPRRKLRDPERWGA